MLLLLARVSHGLLPLDDVSLLLPLLNEVFQPLILGEASLLLPLLNEVFQPLILDEVSLLLLLVNVSPLIPMLL